MAPSPSRAGVMTDGCAVSFGRAAQPCFQQEKMSGAGITRLEKIELTDQFAASLGAQLV
jgi:hypothetical protein